MSRISKYQDSMKKYIMNKSYLSELQNHKNEIFDLLKNSDYIISVILLTILSNKNKKNKTSIHGYYMGSAIELILLLAKINDKQLQEYSYLSSDIINLCNIFLSQNIEHVQSALSKEKINKVCMFTFKYMNSKLLNIQNSVQLVSNNLLKKTDIMKYRFTSDTTLIKQKLYSIKQLSQQELLTYIDDKYGSVGKIAIVFGWLLGSGEFDKISELEHIGRYLGILIKLYYDFINLETDLLNSNDITYNYVINFGIQASLELFLDTKTKFIEGCIIHDSHSTTIKELLDVLDKNIDKFINNTEIDIRTEYTLSNH